MLAVAFCGLSTRMKQGAVRQRVYWVGASLEIKTAAVLIQPQPKKFAAEAVVTVQLAIGPIVTVTQLQSARVS